MHDEPSDHSSNNGETQGDQDCQELTECLIIMMMVIIMVMMMTMTNMKTLVVMLSAKPD